MKMMKLIPILGIIGAILIVSVLTVMICISYFGMSREESLISSTPENSFSYSGIYTKRVYGHGHLSGIGVDCIQNDKGEITNIIVVNSYGITIYRDITFD